MKLAVIVAITSSPVKGVISITASASSESTSAPLDQFTNWYPSTGTAVKITSVFASTSCTSGYALHPAVSAASSSTAFGTVH